MKRILSLVLILVMVLSITACGANLRRSSSSEDDALSDSEIADEEKIHTEEMLPAYFKDPDPVSVINTEKWGHAPVNQILIVFDDNISKEQAQKTIEQIDGTIVGELGFINLYQLETNYKTEADLIAGIDAAFDLDGVEFAFPNSELHLSDAQGTPCTPLKDPIFSDPVNAAHYNIIGMENAWKIIKGSGVELNKVKVGVLDDAIYSGTNEFDGKIKVSGDTTDDPKEEKGRIIFGGLSHGTMVTHVIGADHENSGMVGIASVLDENLHISVKNTFATKKEYKRTELDEDDITQGIYFDGAAYTIKALVHLKQQVDDKATVINCSFGPRKHTDNNEWAVKAYEKFFKAIHKTHPHVVFVASAGNANVSINGKNRFPGGIKLPNVITVGAVNNDGSKAEFSNFASGVSEVTLSAPGVEMMLGVDNEGKPIKASGTSFSAPQVTAAVALIQSINPELNAVQIKEVLVETAAKGITTGDQSIPIPEGMGAGILKVDQAVLKVINDLRKEQKLDPYSMEKLLDMNTVTLSAMGGPEDYTVTAGIPDALGQNVSVKIEVSGQHSLSGDITQTLPAGAATSWGITIAEESVLIRVTRLDNGGCAYMTLESIDLSGSWSGTGTLVDSSFGTELGVDGGFDLSVSINKDLSGTAIVKGVSAPISFDGVTLSFSISVSQYGYTENSAFYGSIDKDESGLLISGSATVEVSTEGKSLGTATYSWNARKTG